MNNYKYIEYIFQLIYYGFTWFIIITFSWLKIWTFSIKKLNLKKNLVLVATETCWIDSFILPMAAIYLKKEYNNIIGISKRDWTTLALKPIEYNEIDNLGVKILFVDRDTRSNQVSQIINKLKKLTKPFILFMFPEGTRKKVERWKTGFHYIAQGTNADIGIIGIDHKKYEVKLDKIYKPYSSAEKNIKYIKKRLRKYSVAYPENTNLD